MSRLSPSASFLAASAVHGPLVASNGLLSAIRSGGSSDDWAQSVRMESTGFPLLDAAIEAWAERSVIPGDVFKLLPDVAKGQAWSLAHQWNTLFVDEMLASLTKVLIEGKTVQDWLEAADGILTKYGAASNAPRLFEGPGTPTPWYADMVFRTNDATFRAAGRYAEMFSREWIAAAPFWLYSAIEDARTRPEHAALDGRVFRKDDASARYLLPPSAYNCRCQAIELTDRDVRQGGYSVASSSDIPADQYPEKDWSADRVESLVPEVLRGSLKPPEDVN